MIGSLQQNCSAKRTIYIFYRIIFMVRNNKQAVERLGLDNSLSICGKNAQLLTRFFNTINAATRK